MTDPDLLYSQDEEDLRGTLRPLLATRSPAAAVLARTEGPEPYDLKLWATLAGELGLAGLVVPERLGGAGASLREAAVVLEELGRAVAPVPYLGSAVVATRVLLGCAATDAANLPGDAADLAGDAADLAGETAELLGRLAAGTATAALAVPFSTSPWTESPYTVRAAGDALTGTVTSVADALPADVLLVPTPDGLYAVHGTDLGLSRSPVVSLDQTRQLCDVVLDGAAGRRLAAPADARAAVSAGLLAGAALLAAEQVGVAEWCLESTVAYAKTRHQFGRPIGSFQAVKHRLADVWAALTQARAVARYAATCVATDDPDAPAATALAQAHCAPVAVTAAEECVQLHGGIGFTWEHPAHLYLKRAKSTALAFGTADRHRAALAAMVDLPAPL